MNSKPPHNASRRSPPARDQQRVWEGSGHGPHTGRARFVSARQTRRDNGRFAARLLAWYDRYGRKNLPWKRGRDPYRIWVAEIMLQQTQVATVIPYYERFVKRFPNLHALAAASLDEVLHHWAGLGYYARARHLHCAAQAIVHEHGGRLPRTLEALQRLPGIGRSTAGAILAFAFGQRQPILDGNVKRVLARYYAIAEPLGRRRTEQRLWALAEQLLPRQRVADYTQAIMDLGATVCRRRQPLCTRCPVRAGCRAYRAGHPEAYPRRTTGKGVPVKRVHMLLIRNRHGRVLLLQQPPTGLWGGLWGLPQCTEDDVAGFCRDRLGLEIAPQPPWPVLRHRFTHFRLDITPIPARLKGGSGRLMENGAALWYNLEQPERIGLPAPVQRLLRKLRHSSWHVW